MAIDALMTVEFGETKVRLAVTLAPTTQPVFGEESRARLKESMRRPGAASLVQDRDTFETEGTAFRMRAVRSALSWPEHEAYMLEMLRLKCSDRATIKEVTTEPD